MKIYEVGIKNRSPRTISADKMEVGSRGELIFKNRINENRNYETKLIINTQKWDYVEVK